MAPDQMGMPAQALSPDQLAIFDQMRQELSPKEFSDEMLAGGAQVDPQAVAQFRQELEAENLPPDVLDALNDMVDAILADPSRYDELRQQYLEQDIPEDMLPEKFDPQFFAALNMAIDQMVGAPAGPQAFAKGGIAELKPIAKALASYGRNGDTMLAHITPAEARMLKRRGGSGTINPDTGLPEFFLKKLFRGVKKALSSVGKAVKKFVNSSVGRVLTTVALGFFLGPAAASMLGATSAAGVAAVSGFVGSAGSTLLGGGSLRDALKAGAIGGLTAGAGAGIMGGAGAFQAGSYTGPTTVGGQWDKLKDMISPTNVGAGPAAPAAPTAPVADAGAAVTPQTPLPGTTPTAPVPAPAVGSTFGPDNIDIGGGQNFAAPRAAPTLIDQGMDWAKKNILPSGIKEEGAKNALASVQKQFPGVTMDQVVNAAPGSVLNKAFNAAMPGVVGTYGPAVAVGLGVMGAAGGFKPNQPPPSALAAQLRGTPGEDLIKSDPSKYLVQNLPGVQYDERGNIIGSSPWQPNATLDDIRAPAAGMGGQGIGSLAPTYTPSAGAMGGVGQISQPYNTSSMYTNLGGGATQMPQVPFPGSSRMPMPGAGMRIGIPQNPFMPGYMQFAEGGDVEVPDPREVESAYGGLASLAQGGYPRRTGQISGPGTETSDSIPAMLSDGEFVMTAKAVKGMGNGSRRAGAKKMYALMHQLERNAARG